MVVIKLVNSLAKDVRMQMNVVIISDVLKGNAEILLLLLLLQDQDPLLLFHQLT